MAAPATVNSPRTPARIRCEEAQSVRSMKSPSQFLTESPLREAKLCPRAGDLPLVKPPNRRSFRAKVGVPVILPAKVLSSNSFLWRRWNRKSFRNQVRSVEFPKD